MAIKVTKEKGHPDNTETKVLDWDFGDCGYDRDGDLWIRVRYGAILTSEGGDVSVWCGDELREHNYTAIKDPNTTVEIKICK